MPMKNDEKSEEELTCHFKIDIRNLTQKLENLKNLHFNGRFWPKYIMIGLKRYKGVIFHDTRIWYKIWRKSDL